MNDSALQWYRVKLGFHETRVQATSIEEAVAAARRQLAIDLPRLYDIIRQMDFSRFEVRHAA